MLIFGHKFIQSDSFYHVRTTDAILNTPPSSTLYVTFSENNLELINYMRENQIKFALQVADITQLIYASSLGASFIVVSREFIKDAQDVANNYLFDAKVLLPIDNDEEIQEMALLAIDGVIFSTAIVKINS